MAIPQVVVALEVKMGVVGAVAPLSPAHKRAQLSSCACAVKIADCAQHVSRRS